MSYPLNFKPYSASSPTIRTILLLLFCFFLTNQQNYQQDKRMQKLRLRGKPLDLIFSAKIPQFQNNYMFTGQRKRIKKTTNQDVIIYPRMPIPSDEMSYFDIKIESTKLGMIGIGVLTHNKMINGGIRCGYCKEDQMYYLYGGDGNVYHGANWIGIDYSKDTKVSRVKTGDIVSIFIDIDFGFIYWFINGKLALSEIMEQKVAIQQLYPFILMATKGDEITILT